MKTILLLILTFLLSCKQGNQLAVIVVDVQSCFTEYKSGSLAVKDTGESFIQLVNKKTKELKDAGIPIYATQDWHPENHVSFFSNHKDKKPFDKIPLNGKEQVLWPPHCVQNTEGANLLLPSEWFLSTVKKGMEPGYDSYSGFMDDGGKKTQMEEILKKAGIKKLLIYGIATDYCVYATATDAKKAGFEVTVVTDLSRGVAPDTTAAAIQDMKSQGIRILDSINIPDLNKL